MWEFISAIVERRPAVPSFYDGLNAQLVADAVLESHAAADLGRYAAGADLSVQAGRDRSRLSRRRRR